MSKEKQLRRCLECGFEYEEASAPKIDFNGIMTTTCPSCGTTPIMRRAIRKWQPYNTRRNMPFSHATAVEVLAIWERRRRRAFVAIADSGTNCCWERWRFCYWPMTCRKLWLPCRWQNLNGKRLELKVLPWKLFKRFCLPAYPTTYICVWHRVAQK